MIIGALKEIAPGEQRVAVTPRSTAALIELGYRVCVESGAGLGANFRDSDYRKAGAEMGSNAAAVTRLADVIARVTPPTVEEVEQLPENSTLISFLWPAQNDQQVSALRRRGITTLAMDCIPRISRAQKMDALSSMANIAGYRAVIEAANEFGSFFTGQITAAGKVPPAKVMVIGAGVAGLAAIGTAKSLGAIVRAFDTRLAAREQVESLGGEFLELHFDESGEGAGGYAKTMSKEFIAAEMALFAEQARDVNIIITTALIPGKPAPKLISREMVKSMQPGSVIVDLAAQQGGNCELTLVNEKSIAHDVSIIGYTDLPSRLPTQSSTLYANNLVNLITDMTPGRDGQLVVDLDDAVVRGALVTHQGEITYPPPKLPDPSPVPVAPPSSEAAQQAEQAFVQADTKRHWMGVAISAAAALLLLLLIGQYAPPDFVSHLTVFVLACFVGWQLVWNVTPALHTPLMSVTNAISGIIVIGGMLQITDRMFSFSSVLAGLAVLVATINVVGGFFVTHRMLGMFRRQD